MFSKKLYNLSLIVLFFVGILIRLYLYLKNPSFWYDEACLGLNILSKSYAELLKGLDYVQVAPPAFLMMSKMLLQMFHPSTDYVRDLTFRFLPFLFSILTLPAFYYLTNIVSKNKKFILFANAFFVLNPDAILYASQYKQYSLELLISVLILICFYKIIIEKTNDKPLYFVVLTLSIWFSYSAFFVLTGGFLCLLIKDRKQFFKYALPVFISSLILYLVNIKSVYATEYAGMCGFWDEDGFLTFHHPTRFILRMGELFVLYKPLRYVAGLVFWISAFYYVIKEKFLYKKLLFLAPIAAVFITSLLHHYPAAPRLFLFMLPMVIMCICLIENKFVNVLKIILLLISITVAPFYKVHCYELVAYSYARDLIPYLQLNAKPDEKILISRGGYEYYYYLYGKTLQSYIEEIPINCGLEKEFQDCKDTTFNLNPGKYYLLITGYYANELIPNNSIVRNIDLGFSPKQVKAVYFEK